MVEPGEIISYREMCDVEKSSLQAGMNFRLNGNVSVLLMSIRPGAPYDDEISGDGQVLIYEGHDEKRSVTVREPKRVDQPLATATGRLTQNGLFMEAASSYKVGDTQPDKVRVYQKLMTGIWVFNGHFRLIDAWPQVSSGRTVYKFKLELRESEEGEWSAGRSIDAEVPRDRLIPSAVKLAVFKRDGGRCVICQANDNLHFDHDLPFSKGGTSLTAENIRILCARHNLQKGARIE